MNIGPLGRKGGGPLVFPVGDGGAGYSRELAEYALGNFQGFPKLADVSGGRAGVPFQDALRDILQNPELFFQILVGIQIARVSIGVRYGRAFPGIRASRSRVRTSSVQTGCDSVSKLSVFIFSILFEYWRY